MNRYLLYLLCGSLFLGMAELAIAGDCSIEKQATLPITFNGHYATVPVTIDGEELHIAIDTGAEHTVITPETAAKLNLTKDMLHFSNIVGVSGLSRVGHVGIFSFNFAGKEYSDISLAVVEVANHSNPLEVRNFDEPKKMAGLIGSDLLSLYDVDYDPVHRLLTLYNVKNCHTIAPPWQGPYQIIPVKVTPTAQIILPVTLDGHRLAALFDTGANIESLLATSLKYGAVTREMLLRDRAGRMRGASGQFTEIPVHRFNAMQIGSEILKDINVGIINMPALGMDMLVGEDYMQSRHFWISYHTKALFIQH